VDAWLNERPRRYISRQIYNLLWVIFISKCLIRELYKLLNDGLQLNYWLNTNCIPNIHANNGSCCATFYLHCNYSLKTDPLFLCWNGLFVKRKIESLKDVRSWKEDGSFWYSGYDYIDAALLSINFLDYSVYYTIMAWITLIWVLIMHSMALIDEIK